MDVGAEPSEQAAELALPNLVLERMRACIGLGQLRRVEAAQRIGRKISEHAERPVDILEDAFAVRCRPCPDQRGAPLVPDRGKIANANAPEIKATSSSYLSTMCR